MANYKRGDSKQIIVGAAALFAYDEGNLAPDTLPELEEDISYRETLSDPVKGEGFRNVGFTMNGLEIVFQPDFGEVQVDQFLDVARLYKQGMQVNLNTAFAESTLENLLLAIAGGEGDLGMAGAGDFATGNPVLDLVSGDIGECPVERGLVAVGPGTGDCALGSAKERIYVAYRALSIENVTVSAKRDEATMFEVSFRLLPEDESGSYGKIVDRTVSLES